MAGKNQIVGGEFQDFEGNVLANGYLTMQLSHDAEQSIGPSQVVAGYPLRVPLDANGDIAGTVLVWPNDQLDPPQTFYIVNAYRHDGTSAWAAPQYQTVASSPSPFDVGVWVPNNPPSGGSAGAPVGSLLLQTNGVNNASQNIQNLTAGTDITLTDEGGGEILITATGATTPATTKTVLWSPGPSSGSPFVSGQDTIEALDSGATTANVSPTASSDYAIEFLGRRYHLSYARFSELSSNHRTDLNVGGHHGGYPQ